MPIVKIEAAAGSFTIAWAITAFTLDVLFHRQAIAPLVVFHARHIGLNEGKAAAAGDLEPFECAAVRYG
jgi:hypothetical protein